MTKLNQIHNKAEDVIENTVLDFESSVSEWELGDIDSTRMLVETEKALEVVWTLQYIGLITIEQAQKLSDKFYDEGYWLA